MIIYLKRLKSSKFVRVKAFPMYGGIGVSAPSLHRESTDSLIVCPMLYRNIILVCCVFTWRSPALVVVLSACPLEDKDFSAPSSPPPSSILTLSHSLFESTLYMCGGRIRTQE